MSQDQNIDEYRALERYFYKVHAPFVFKYVSACAQSHLVLFLFVSSTAFCSREPLTHIFLNAFVVFAFGTAALANCCCVFHLVLHRNGVCCPTRAVQVSGQHCAFFFAVHFFVFFGGGEGRYCALQPNPRLSFVPPLLTASLCLATLSLLLLLLLPPSSLSMRFRTPTQWLPSSDSVQQAIDMINEDFARTDIVPQVVVMYGAMAWLCLAPSCFSTSLLCLAVLCLLCTLHFQTQLCWCVMPVGLPRRA